MADHERRDLHVPDGLGDTMARFGAKSTRPEEIPALPERIGDERDDELTLDHEEREVVRDEVRSGDRDERQDEVGDE